MLKNVLKDRIAYLFEGLHESCPPFIAQVCYKITDFLGDQVLLAASAHGGLSEVPRPSFRTCSNAFKLVSEIGQFGHPPEVCFFLSCCICRMSEAAWTILAAFIYHV